MSGQPCGHGLVPIDATPKLCAYSHPAAQSLSDAPRLVLHVAKHGAPCMRTRHRCSELTQPGCNGKSSNMFLHPITVSGCAFADDVVRSQPDNQRRTHSVAQCIPRCWRWGGQVKCGEGLLQLFCGTALDRYCGGFVLLQKCNVSEYGNLICNQITYRPKNNRPVGHPGDLVLRPYHLTPPESEARTRHMDSLCWQEPKT